MQLVNVPKSDGFTALHIAAMNGYKLTATALIEVVSSAATNNVREALPLALPETKGQESVAISNLSSLLNTTRCLGWAAHGCNDWLH